MKKSFILILLFFSPGVLHAGDPGVEKYPVISYEKIDVRSLNKQISSAAKQGEKWVFHPLLIAQKYQMISMTKIAWITMENDPSEGPTKSIITVIEDGYLDDSVRGKWMQFRLERSAEEEIWEVKEIREAYLCGRMNSPKEFSKALCP